jgi:molybdopterin-guanine dinucleotide biosynthesis protein A
LIKPDTIAGLVLAGGRSSRFGTNKALAQFGERTLLHHALVRFSECRTSAVAVRGDGPVAEHARALGARTVDDAANAPEGPLAGIAAGLAWAQANACRHLAVSPCDAPFLRWSHYQRLFTDVEGAPAAFAVTATGDHPLCAVWSSALLPKLRAAMFGGRHPSVSAFLRDVGARAVLFEDTRSFANANTPSDLAALAGAPS